MIKLDIVNAIVQKTNITRTKAEQAVETVFEAMKNALGRGERIELRRFGVLPVEYFQWKATITVAGAITHEVWMRGAKKRVPLQ